MNTYKTEKFTTINPGLGSHGDTLLYCGTYSKLEELNITFSKLNYQTKWRAPRLTRLLWKIWLTLTKLFRISGLGNTVWAIDNSFYELLVRIGLIDPGRYHISNKVILILGGGAINDMWHEGIRLLKNVIENNKDGKKIIIVAPSSYWFWKTNFAKILSKTNQPTIYLCCRERYSHSLLTSMNLPKNVHLVLSKDTAFYFKDLPQIKKEKYDLVSIRNDRESILPKRVFSIIRKIAKEKKDKILVEDIENPKIRELEDLRSYLKVVAESRRVYTDRLHVAITAAMMGKETYLFPNNYHKSKGVYEYSLRNRSNIKFLENQKDIEDTLLGLTNAN